MSGGPGNDGLHGGYGNDDLSGGPGDDLLRSYQGADSFKCGAGYDRVFYFNQSEDTKSSDCEYISTGFGNETLSGVPSNETLSGLPANFTKFLANETLSANNSSSQ